MVTDYQLCMTEMMQVSNSVCMVADVYWVIKYRSSACVVADVC